ncbi:hypothetical protein CDAR_217821 [Caerostris darwini]|uniref:Uncharacterized protein n=1 Tax=Caerostris darwini TaxID=1538125 RepID=A0AAV4MYR6_9ARAC|nr:hypothetical protein CDAR_217821 [Caerostris darwini]
MFHDSPAAIFLEKSMTASRNRPWLQFSLKAIFRELATHTHKNSVTEFFINPHTFTRKFLAIPFGDSVPAQIVAEREKSGPGKLLGGMCEK